MVKSAEFKPKVIIDGFPKSGLHLAVKYLEPVLDLMPDSEIWGREGWTGTFAGNSWTNERIRQEITCYRISRMHEGQYMKGHIGWSPEIEQFIYYFGASHVLIVRDFRDVAVSQAHHVLSEADLAHPDKERYRAMGDFEKVLKAVIVGIEGFPGIFERWAEYAPWLDVKWSEVLTFEEMRYRREETAKKFIGFLYGRLGQVMDGQIVANQDAFQAYIDKMVESSHETDTRTFRKGVSGSWREVFTDEIKQAFKRADKDNWLVRLKYEKDHNW